MAKLQHLGWSQVGLFNLCAFTRTWRIFVKKGIYFVSNAKELGAHKSLLSWFGCWKRVNPRLFVVMFFANFRF